jgi:RNA polymerase sigma-70 factor (ECF subfamily)
VDRPTDENIAQWYPRIYRTALRQTGNHEDASDLTQQAFYKALANWRDFQGQCLPTTWLHKILCNCVIDWRRRRSGGEETGEGAFWESLAKEETVSQAATQEQIHCLRQEITGLDSTLRGAFVATVIDGYSYEEAAELLSIPVGTVASRVYTARQLLAQRMKRKFKESLI